MRGAFRAALIAALLAIGCHHDKYNLIPKFREQAVEPPDAARYNLPETAELRAPAPKKEDKSASNGNIPGAPGRSGGFGP